MEKTDFFKERSISSCLKSAFDLYCSNFATIFRKTWIPALVGSIVLFAGVPASTRDHCTHDC